MEQNRAYTKRVFKLKEACTIMQRVNMNLPVNLFLMALETADEADDT